MALSLDVLEPDLRDVDFGSATITDTQAQIDRLQASGRVVVPVRYFDQVAFMVLGYDAVTEIFLNEAELPAADYYERFTKPGWGHTVPTMRGDEHRRHREFFMLPLLPRRMQNCTTKALLPIADELISGFADRSRVDFVADYARPYPFRVITRLLGLPDADNAAIQKRVSELFQFNWQPEVAARARAEMAEYLRPIALARRADPGDDIISTFASTEVGGELLDETTLLDFIRFVYAAAGENTTNALGLMIDAVLRDLAVYERVLADAADRYAAVEEALRVSAAVPFIPRYVEQSMHVFGADIPEGSCLLLAISAANRDPRQFADPTRFSLDRGVNRHMAFGRGPHLCAGLHLARAELRVTLDRMLDRLPGLRLEDPDAVAYRGGVMRGAVSLPLMFDEILPAGSPAANQ